MKYLSLLLSAFGVLFGLSVTAQTKTLPLNDGANLKIYQLEPTSKTGNQTTGKVAVSYNKGNEEPVFGMLWFEASTSESGNQVQLQNLKVVDLKIPQLDDALESSIKNQIVTNASKINFSLTKTQFDNALSLYQKETAQAKNIQNVVPKIIYAKKPSILVLVDGQPHYQNNDELGVRLVVNSPFTIVQHTDGKHYIYGGKNWYVSNTLKGDYSITTNLPAKISQVQTALQNLQSEEDNQGFEEYDENTIYSIIVSTEPAELIQSNGEANFSPVTGTNLLYVDNSDDDIFMDINTQQYYTLLSGRWYTSNSLQSNWKYVSSDNLPADFAKIIEGSTKDNVLAAVAGTDAANEALLDAQIPQTAKVSRSSNATIEYDGNPNFENIEGTNLQYAVNSPSSVIKYGNRYYAVDDGIWYVSNSASGPWTVATERPDEVANIPPSSPVYNIKYVYIYDVTPDYVYMGYTPGYLNTFIYGPTIVYGTGYYYRPWIGRYYYARPYTWGFGIRYNPWYGFSFGFNYYSGWFYDPWRYHVTSWWGPRLYRPTYVYRPYGGHMVRSGFYSNRYYNNYRNQIVRGVRNNNIYNGRRNVVTMDRGRLTNPSTNNGRITRPPRNVERNTIARNQNPNAGRVNRSPMNRESRVGTAPNGNRIDRSYRNNNGTVGRTNREGVNPNRNNGINRDYRNNNNNRNIERGNGSGNVARPNRTSPTQRPQIAENRQNGIENGRVRQETNPRIGENNNRNRPSPNVSPNTNSQPRSNAEVSRPNSSPSPRTGRIERTTPSRSNEGSVQRSNPSQSRSTPNVNRGGGSSRVERSAPARSSGGNVQRSSGSSSRSTPSVNRGSSSSSSRSGGTPARSGGSERGRQ